MQVQQITDAVLDEEIRQLEMDRRMMGEMGAGLADAGSLLRGNEKFCMEILTRMFANAFAGDKLASKIADTPGPKEAAAILAAEPDLSDLPIKMFLLGLRLGQKASATNA